MSKKRHARAPYEINTLRVWLPCSYISPIIIPLCLDERPGVIFIKQKFYQVSKQPSPSRDRGGIERHDIKEK